MKTHSLTGHELNLANFKLAADNNAMLRILLENQLKIMDTLGISDAGTKFSFESVSPPVAVLPDTPIPLDELSRAEFKSNITAADIISKSVRRRSREWIKQKK